MKPFIFTILILYQTNMWDETLDSLCWFIDITYCRISQVDPIVASFSGGAVGVISTLMLIEANNVEQQEKKRCKYCNGTGKCCFVK